MILRCLQATGLAHARRERIEARDTPVARAVAAGASLSGISSCCGGRLPPSHGRGLRRYCVIGELTARLESLDGLVPSCRQLSEQTTALEGELRTPSQSLAPNLLVAPGYGVLGTTIDLGAANGCA